MKQWVVGSQYAVHKMADNLTVRFMKKPEEPIGKQHQADARKTYLGPAPGKDKEE